MLIYVTILIILLLQYFKTGPRVTNVVLAGDLVPASTVLVTPGIEQQTCLRVWRNSADDVANKQAQHVHWSH